MNYEIKKSKTPITFTMGSRRVIVGGHPEMADMDNPSGHIYGDAYFIQAQNEAGYRWDFHEGFEDRRRAEYKFKALRDGEELVEDEWLVGQPVYGSRAYEAEGCEMEQVFRETGGRP